MKVSIIIPSFQRAHLLKWNLLSLSKQAMPFDFETIVLNDGVLDETEAICEQYREQLNIKYYFTGHRNLSGQMIWRVPGFVINIGVKQSTGDVIVICCAEIFHLNNTIELITNVYGSEGSNKVIAIPKAKDDNGAFLSHIEANNGAFNIEEYNRQPPLINVKYPFFLAMKKNEFVDIGGYDEDFTGTDYDDQDFIERLEANSCSHVETGALAIHLWHPRLVRAAADIAPRFQHNKSLYEQRQGIIVRNMGREWGKYDG
jgi:glycosyltransferase involved in cell wall biosynthesis